MVITSRSHGLNAGAAESPRSGEAAMPIAPPALAEDGGAMPADPLTTAFLHFGLGIREAQLYRALLKYGPMSARQSINLAGLDRATGYRVLSKLRARGLITSTPTRPQRFVPLDVNRLFERTVTVLRDDLELLRVLRDHYVSDGAKLGRDSRGNPAPPPTSPVPPRARWPDVRVFPRSEEIARAISALVDLAKDELDVLMMPHVLPENRRSDVVEAIARAVNRGVRVRMVVDYHATDLEFLAALLKHWGQVPVGLDFRFYAPQLSRLYLVDHRVALRCVRTAGSPSTGPELGVQSDEMEFVRYQAARFQSIWREGLPLQKTDSASSERHISRALDNPRELRRWVERGAMSAGRVAAAELARLFGFGPSVPYRT